MLNESHILLFMFHLCSFQMTPCHVISSRRATVWLCSQQHTTLPGDGYQEKATRRRLSGDGYQETATEVKELLPDPDWGPFSKVTLSLLLLRWRTWDDAAQYNMTLFTLFPSARAIRKSTKGSQDFVRWLICLLIGCWFNICCDTRISSMKENYNLFKVRGSSFTNHNILDLIEFERKYHQQNRKKKCVCAFKFKLT